MENHHDEILQKLLGINLNIKFQLLKKIEFSDFATEKNFLSLQQIKLKNQKIL